MRENLLNLPPDPTPTQVKQAWHSFALKWHPDLHPAGTKEVEERFKRAHAEYAALCARPSVHSEYVAADENVTASYVRRRRPMGSTAMPTRGYGSLGYDQNAGSKIFLGLSVFGLFCVWACFAWSPQSHESRREQQALSTVSYGEQHAFWRASNRHSSR